MTKLLIALCVLAGCEKRPPKVVARPIDAAIDAPADADLMEDERRRAREKLEHDAEIRPDPARIEAAKKAEAEWRKTHPHSVSKECEENPLAKGCN